MGNFLEHSAVIFYKKGHFQNQRIVIFNIYVCIYIYIFFFNLKSLDKSVDIVGNIRETSKLCSIYLKLI